MTERRVEHATVTVERKLRAAPARVFSAYADREQRVKWDVPGEDWVVSEFEQDFRIGGREFSRFGKKGSPELHSEGVFLDIAQDRRIVSAGTMHDKNVPMTSTLCTIEILPDGAGSQLILTDQSAYFGDEKPSDRKQGWNEIMDKLEAFLGR